MLTPTIERVDGLILECGRRRWQYQTWCVRWDDSRNPYLSRVVFGPSRLVPLPPLPALPSLWARVKAWLSGRATA